VNRLVVATTNRGKLKEIGKILEDFVTCLLSPSDFPCLPEVVEDGETFEENAVKKALSAARATGLPALADDSGLVVDALGGLPGVRSARFAGEFATDEENNEKLLCELAGISGEARRAAFCCVIAVCCPDGTCCTFKGELSGFILEAPRGREGFGYDPLFLVPAYGKTLAELPLEVKNVVSHRGTALLALKDYFSKHGGVI
jgi:XTP/dITP diphosphohydrolase